MYIVIASTLKYTQLYGLTITTRTEGSLRTLSLRRGLPNIFQSTTDPLFLPNKLNPVELSGSTLKSASNREKEKGDIDILHVHGFFLSSLFVILLFRLLQLTTLGQRMAPLVLDVC